MYSLRNSYLCKVYFDICPHSLSTILPVLLPHISLLVSVSSYDSNCCSIGNPPGATSFRKVTLPPLTAINYQQLAPQLEMEAHVHCPLHSGIFTVLILCRIFLLAPCLSQLLIPSQADVLLYSPHQLIMSSALGMDYSYIWNINHIKDRQVLRLQLFLQYQAHEIVQIL